jgi:uncharacterized protein (TIGR00725 family)
MLAKTNKTIKRVAFFGDAEAKKNDEHFKQAFNTAKLLAKEGFIIVNGGGPGVMLASTLGAKEEGGKVEIVVLDPKRQPENYEGICETNFDMADKKIFTKNYSHRLNKLIEVADAFVIFKGGTGTLSEVGLTWEMAKFEYGHHEPLIFFGDYWRETIESMEKNLDFDKKEKTVYQIVYEAGEVAEILTKKKGFVHKGFFGRMLEAVKG